jgi:hypothetical protein
MNENRRGRTSGNFASKNSAHQKLRVIFGQIDNRRNPPGLGGPAAYFHTSSFALRFCAEKQTNKS